MKILLWHVILTLSLCFACSCACCKSTDPNPQTQPTQPVGTLFDRLGKDAGIRNLVSAWVARALAPGSGVDFTRNGAWNPSSSHREKLISAMTTYIASRTGGPSAYGGASMADIHRSMSITPAQFDAFLNLLPTAATNAGVDASAAAELQEKLRQEKPQYISPPTTVP